jgi:hypothetical protein
MEPQELLALLAFLVIYLMSGASARKKRRQRAAQRRDTSAGEFAGAQPGAATPPPDQRSTVRDEPERPKLIPQELWEEIERLARGDGGSRASGPTGTVVAEAERVEGKRPDEEWVEPEPETGGRRPVVAEHGEFEPGRTRLPAPIPESRLPARPREYPVPTRSREASVPTTSSGPDRSVVRKAARAFGDRPGAAEPEHLVARRGQGREDKRGVLELLRHQSPEGLRRAFVLQEVFGPPLAVRPRRDFGDPGD